MSDVVELLLRTQEEIRKTMRPILVEVRMHPDDWEDIASRYGAGTARTELGYFGSILDVPVYADDTRPRGDPKLVYADAVE